MRSRTLSGKVLVIAAVLSGPSPQAIAKVVGPPALDVPVDPSPHTDVRIVALERRLATEDRFFAVWRGTWIAAYGALALGNLAALPAVSHASRIDYYTGAVTSGIGTLTVALQPPQLLADVGCQAETSQRLACVERRYGDVTAFQRSSRGWLAHVINFAFNAGVSAFLGFGYARWQSATTNLLVGTAIGELQIGTQPHGALETPR